MSVPTPESSAEPLRTLAWGDQIDVRAIGGDDGDVQDTSVARYIAKYATKSTESAGLDLRSLACRACAGCGTVVVSESGRACRDCLGTGRRADAVADLDGLSPHARSLVDACWRLGGLEEFAPLKLRRWAHMLGFRGHFATKSRTYSTTFAALRAERAEFRAARVLDALGLGVGDAVAVVNDWRFAGRGSSSASAAVTAGGAR